ncbi:MAG: hypothetical protein SFT94_12245 [Pseudanabaenaceae cyanobacterium bins.68]|nr:hypothetical protein [Pseudanabaenaceae cyanobacterium bins.68]
MIKFPLIAVLTILASYTGFGWLLALHSPPQLFYWFGSGALCFGLNYFLSLAWGIAALVIVFVPKANLIILSVGITVVWASLLYIARLEILALTSSKVGRFILMVGLAAIALMAGWLLNTALDQYNLADLWLPKR